MVLAGHEHAEARRTDTNRCGGRVFQLLADYLDRPNGGDAETQKKLLTFLSVLFNREP
jgi:hypothetical protein